MSGATMYLRVPEDCTFDLTSAVRATGEKTAREPDWSLTRVPRPPTLMRPNRRKGVLKVVIAGATSRMTITLAGSDGMRLAADLEVDMFGQVLGFDRKKDSKGGTMSVSSSGEQESP